jgi:hypothetical protein
MWKLPFMMIILLNFIIHAFSQHVYFDFENGDINNWNQCHSGSWHCDTVKPIRGLASLHHCFDNKEAGFDAISFNYDIIQLNDESLTIEFALRYEYRPSSSNNWAVWLAAENNASHMHPKAENNGYFLGVNYIGSDDYLKLWKKQGGKISEVLTTNLNWQESFETGSTVWIKVTKSESGLWTVYYSLTAEKKWQTTGSAVDNSIESGKHLGIYYNYSSSQDQKLWLDEISIWGKFLKDTEPPNIDSYRILDQKSIEILFSEPIDTAYKGGVMRLNKKFFPIEQYWQNNRALTLLFESSFNQLNKLEFFDFKDLSGNSSELIQIDFNYYLAEKYDIIISEIMADPTPSMGLPEYEYLELVNTSDQQINVYNWNLLVGNDTITLPDHIIHPGMYLMLCNQKYINHFPDSIHKLGLSGLPALKNSGELIQLISNSNILMHAVQYSQDLYNSSAKKEGGWSLEIMDIHNACKYKGNWMESGNIIGGTPGKTNSVSGNLTDTVKPFIERLILLDDQHLELLFSENLNESSISTISNYYCEGLPFLDSEIISYPYFNQVVLTLKEKLKNFQKHALQLKPELTDCYGNMFRDEKYYFGIPQIPDSNDIIINEILFESSDNIPEYIELYNKSEKIIDLRNFALAFYDNFSESFANQLIFCRENLYFSPGEYRTITKNKEQLTSSFQIDDVRHVFQPEKWKNLANEGGKIGLMSPDGSILDEAYFEKEMHFGLLYETSGVSLERIADYASGLDKNNWHSASSNSNYGTPCKQNSQYYFLNKNDNYFEVNPNEISPNNDGDMDYLTISYHFEKPGYLISIFIYNAQGMLITKIANNELCGFKGSYYWEGLGDDKDKLPFGYYIVYCSAMHPEGYKKMEKKSILLLP